MTDEEAITLALLHAPSTRALRHNDFNPENDPIARVELTKGEYSYWVNRKDYVVQNYDTLGEAARAYCAIYGLKLEDA